MTRLPVVSGREVIVALERLGYVVVRQRGGHVRMRHPAKTDCHPVTVPSIAPSRLERCVQSSETPI